MEKSIKDTVILFLR